MYITIVASFAKMIQGIIKMLQGGEKGSTALKSMHPPIFYKDWGEFFAVYTISIPDANGFFDEPGNSK